MTGLHGLTVLAPAAGSGKTGLSIGLARVLADQGLPVEPFKAVAVVDPSDPDYLGVDPAEYGVFHNCAAARRPVNWWNNPVLVVADGCGGGELFVRGESFGTVKDVGADSLNLLLLPPRLRLRCLDAVRAGLDELRGGESWVIVEGGGAAGELPPEADLANHVAPDAAKLPVLLVGNPSRSGHLAALIGLTALLAPEVTDLTAGYVLNQVRDDAHLVDVRTRLTGRIALPELGVLPLAERPAGYDGSAEIREWMYQRRAQHVADSGLVAWLLGTGVRG